MNTRLIASKIINAVTDGASLADVLPKQLEKLSDARDRALVQAIVFGVCRYYEQLDFVLSELLQKPMKAKDSDVHALLLVGLYQLMFMRIPEHAAVSETVKASEKLRKAWSKGFINGVLRSYMRQKEKLVHKIENDIEARYAHPYWIIDAVKQAWPEHWQSLLNANNEHPPFTLRVNLQKHSRDAYMQQLSGDIDVIPQTTAGIILKKPIAVDELPGFAEGDVSVQDGAAQLAAELLQLTPGQRVLDACAAPGGKLIHMLECEPDLQATAVEKDQHRITQINENLDRHQLASVNIKCADAVDLSSWWDNKPFDRILLDAPCSASGVIRRHPDIKLLRQLTDIKPLAKEQASILAALWKTLAKDGLLLYATCSIFPDENVDVVKQFLNTHPDACEEVITGDWGIACDVGRQILPGMHSMDGFYYALLRKN